MNILLPIVAWPQNIKKTNKVSVDHEMQVCGMCAIFYKLYAQKLNYFSALTFTSKQRVLSFYIYIYIYLDDKVITNPKD